MANITHKITISSGIKTAVNALITIDGLKAWWTTDTSGTPRQDGLIKFRFNDHGPDMIVETSTGTKIIWRCIAGPEDWLNTTIEYQLKPEGTEQTEIYFTHRGWAEENPFHYHCSMKWAVFLLSLKEYLELGVGRPFPDDIQIEGPLEHKVS